MPSGTIYISQKMEIKEVKLVIATGIARFDMKGEIPSRTHTFDFDIDVTASFAAGVKPQSAVVTLAIANIANGSQATDMEYDFLTYSNTYDIGRVRVAGDVKVGD